MNELKIFENTEFGQLEVMLVGGKPYFPATGCAKVLGYTNPQEAIRYHCKGVRKMLTPSAGGTQQANYIPEGDLYRLILRSKLPAAERFEAWVVNDVLPSIRQTGGYMPDMKELAVQVAAATVSELMRQLLPLMKSALGAEPTETQPRFSMVKEITEPKLNQCKMGTFPSGLREQVDSMIEEMQKEQALNFSRIARFCTLQGFMISSPAVRRYYDKHFN